MTYMYPYVSNGFLICYMQGERRSIRLESEDWWCWLKERSCDLFRYESPWGGFTARREWRDEQYYWYTCWQHADRIHKKYLGTIRSLTNRHLLRHVRLLKKEKYIAQVMVTPVLSSPVFSNCSRAICPLTRCADAKDVVPNNMHSSTTIMQSDLALRAREVEVVRYVVAGLSNSDIAQRMCIAESTVRWYIKNIYLKLQVHNRVQLVIRVQELYL